MEIGVASKDVGAAELLSDLYGRMDVAIETMLPLGQEC
jgi:hypothetical protein